MLRLISFITLTLGLFTLPQAYAAGWKTVARFNAPSALTLSGTMKTSSDFSKLVIGVNKGDPVALLVSLQQNKFGTPIPLTPKNFKPDPNKINLRQPPAIALSQDGTTIAVGVTGTQQQSGVVYIFGLLPTGEWGEIARLTPTTPEIAREFGRTVAISPDGNRIAVTAYSDIISPSTSGTVLLYQKSNSGWSEVTRISAPTDERTNLFGFGLVFTGDTTGNTLIVGAPNLGANYNASASVQGQVFVFRSDPTGRLWDSMQNLEFYGGQPPFGGIGGRLDVSTDGRILVVGSPAEQNSDSQDFGTAYIFARLQNGTFKQTARLNGAQPDPDRFLFGLSSSITVSADGNIIYAGSPSKGMSGSFMQGAVSQFTRNTETAATWDLSSFLRLPGKRNFERFGWEIETNSDGKQLIVLARDGAGGLDKNAIYWLKQ